MKAEVYSIWLMPEAAWEQEFSAIVDELATRFSTPRFRPHLTIVGGRPFDRADLKRRLSAAVAGTAPIEAAILDVAVGDAFFRSFYALFPAEGALRELKRRTDLAVLGAEAAEFMPHVSLLYGPVAPRAKAEAALPLRTRLTDRRVRFERIEIVRSGDEVPIDEWETVETFAL
jgi:2'-5' RNA ligase